MRLPKDITEILERFHAAGAEAYVVGGAVRDSLMGKAPADFDIATAALPEQVKNLFRDHRMIETGIRHGTVTLLWGETAVEITTFRTESGYSDFRRPDRVCFSASIRADLSRRDFTVNAVCYSPVTGYYDPFDGMEDIKRRLLRTVGDPNERFFEDALRILRVLRFAAVLGFEIESETASAAVSLRGLLCSISAERIMAELKKLLAGHFAPEVLNAYFVILAAALPPLAEYAETAVDFSPLRGCPKQSDAVRLSAFLLCAAKSAQKAAALAEPVMRFLKSDNRLRKEVCLLTEMFSAPVPADKTDLKHLLQRMEPRQAEELFCLWEAFEICDGLKTQALRQTLTEITESHQCFRLCELAVTGEDLLAEGLRPKEVGAALQMLLNAVIDEACENETDSLLAFLRQSRA